MPDARGSGPITFSQHRGLVSLWSSGETGDDRGRGGQVVSLSPPLLSQPIPSCVPDATSSRVTSPMALVELPVGYVRKVRTTAGFWDRNVHFPFYTLNIEHMLYIRLVYEVASRNQPTKYLMNR